MPFCVERFSNYTARIICFKRDTACLIVRGGPLTLPAKIYGSIITDYMIK